MRKVHHQNEHRQHVQILALTLLHIHTLPGGPLPLLCSRAHAGMDLPPPSHTPTLRHTLSPREKTPEAVCGSLGGCLLVNVCAEFSSNL